MLLPNELDASGRLIIAIKTYHQQTSDNLAPSSNEILEAYLHQHLSGEDWLFWQRLRVDEREAYMVDQAAEEHPLGKFEQLFNQYKRAGYEYIQVWIQKRSEPQ